MIRENMNRKQFLKQRKMSFRKKKMNYWFICMKIKVVMIFFFEIMEKNNTNIILQDYIFFYLE